MIISGHKKAKSKEGNDDGLKVDNAYKNNFIDSGRRIYI